MSRTDLSHGKLGRDAMTYGLSFLVSRAASIVMLPVYTQFLTPRDYGVLHLVELTLDVAALLFREGITAACMRFYFKSDDAAARRATISTTLFLVVAFHTIAALLLYGAATVIADRLLGGAPHVVLVRIAATSLLFQAGVLVPMIYMQIRQKARLYMGVSLARLVIAVSLNVLFLVGLGLGPRGPLLSTMLVNILLGLPMVVWTLREVGVRFDRAAALDLLRFGIPYRIAQLGAFVLTFGDRFFLKAYHELDVIGIYSLAYQFGFMLMLASATPFLQAWNPQRFELAKLPRTARDAQYNAGLVYLSALIVAAGVGIALFVRPVLSAIADPAFLPAVQIVPIIVLAYAFQAWTDVVELGIQISERTEYAMYATWASVALVVGLYVVLIPRYGAFGAATATLIAFAFRFVCFYGFSQRLWPVTYAWRPTVTMLAYGIAVVVGSLLWEAATTGGRWAQATLLFLVFCGLAWFGGGIGIESRRTLVQGLRQGLHAVTGK